MKNFLGHFFYYQKSKFNEKWFKLNLFNKSFRFFFIVILFYKNKNKNKN